MLRSYDYARDYLLQLYLNILFQAISLGSLLIHPLVPISLNQFIIQCLKQNTIFRGLTKFCLKNLVLVNPIKIPFLFLPHAFQGHHYLEAFGVLDQIELRAVFIEILPFCLYSRIIQSGKTINKPFILYPKFLTVLELGS